MPTCTECSRPDTKYSCISCGSAICQVCSSTANENEEGYSEQDKHVGFCSICITPGTSGTKRAVNFDEMSGSEDDSTGINVVKTVYKTITTKKQASLNSFFGGKAKPTPPKKAKVDQKKKSTPRMVTVDTVRKNWIENILAKYDAREWLDYDTDGKNAINLRCKVNYLLFIHLYYYYYYIFRHG